MDFLVLPLRALIDPLGAIPTLLDKRRWVMSLCLAAGLSAASGAAIATRLDTARQIIPQMQKAGNLGKASEREVAEAVEQAQRVALVAGVAKGLLLLPLLTLLLAVALKVAAWLVGRKATFYSLFVVATVALLPGMVFHVVELAAALRLDVITPTMASTLIPSSLASMLTDVSGGAQRVLAAFDFFNIWGAALMGLGFAYASQWAPWKGILFGVFLYSLYAAAFLVGLPGVIANLGAGGMS